MPGSITPYFWEDFLLANSKREKYLQADGYGVELSDFVIRELRSMLGDGAVILR